MSEQWSATGRCRCGRTTFVLRGRPMLTMACHCRGCQQLTGGPYSLTSVHSRDDFELTGGSVEPGGLQGPSFYAMCGFCKSWIYTAPAGRTNINVRSPLFDNPPAEPPFVEVATDEGFAWARIGARHSFSSQPSAEEYPPILAEFAAQFHD